MFISFTTVIIKQVVFCRFRFSGDDIGRTVREHKPPGVEERVPELGGPLQADPEALASAALRAEGALPAASKGQQERYTYEKSTTGMSVCPLDTCGVC